MTKNALALRRAQLPGMAVFAVLAATLAHSEDIHAQSATTSQTLPSVTIDARTNQGSMRPGALSDELVRTESISARSIERSGATNINEAVDKQPGIAVQVECSICNVRNVLLNNLPGRYTTLLIDGIPIYSSVSSAYGLDSVSVDGLERIDIARGAGASLIAPEALAGTVNLVTRRPTELAAKLRTQAGSFGSRQADAYLAKPLDGGAFTLSGSYNRHNSVDANGDGISEYTGYDRRMLGIGGFVDDLGGFKIRSRIDLVDEKRGGGALGRDYAAIKASNSGNPFNFTRGPNGSPFVDGWVIPENGEFMPYDSGRGGFSEIIFTKRSQFVASGERRLGDGTLRLALGAAHHRQDSFYELATYLGDQKQYYAEASYQVPVGTWLLTSGASYRYENLRSHGSTDAGALVNGIDNYTFKVPGAFVQAYRSFLDDALEVNASLRYDRHSAYGGIVSPRFNALYHHTPLLASRLSIGKGFRAPTSFFEQDHGILDTLRIDRRITKPEVSHNLGYALNYADDRLAVTASYNFNRIKNFALLDPGQFDENGEPVTLFTSAEKPVTVQGLDLNLSYQLTPALTVSGGGELYAYRFPAGTLIFARPKARAFFGLDYESGPLDLTAKLVVTGPMDLNRFHDDGSGSQNRFNFDGTPKRTKSPTFATLDVRAEYAVNSRLSLYAGVDNLFNYRQSKKEGFLWISGSGAQDVTHLWGPNRGRFVYAGAKFSL
ncbi:TonB-dependent receptor plug domain-containing protein [Variovorax boronicumulans]|uniref:TonB-dependent receptor plug domain-containing protein n=1 Tax=Variovorax boronicumulans TaxID=436515 RepID=UPI00339B7620